MPKLLSNRKPVKPVDNLTEDRFKYLGLNQAQPALGKAPTTSTGYTIKTDENGKASFSNDLGGLNFTDQIISTTLPGDMVFTNTNGNVIISPLVKAQINGATDIRGDLTISGKIISTGDGPLGTAPVVSNVLYVTMDGDDRNDGRALDATRACRTISGAVRSPYYQEGTVIKVQSGHYYEENPIPLKGYTCVIGDDLRTVFVEPLNRDLDLFHVNSGVYIAQMQMRNLRRGSVERYAPGGAGTYTTGAYCVAFPPNLENPIDVYYSPYIQNCTNQTGPWLKDGTMFFPNQTVQIPLAAGVSSWVAHQTTITVSVVTGTIVVGMAVNDGANEGYRNAQLLLKANKSFLQNEVVAYVDQTFSTSSFTYSSSTCYRDVGLIVDGLATDLLYGSTSESIFSGLQYWNQGTYTGAIPSEITTTTAAISYAKTLAANTVSSYGFSSFVTQAFTTITNILTDGVAGITDKIVSNGPPSTNVNRINAYNALIAAIPAITSQTINYVTNTLNFTNYTTATCQRDIGYIISSVAFDLLNPNETNPNGTNRQSIKSGVYYYSYNSTSTAIPNEIPQTTAAYTFIRGLVSNIMTGTQITNVYQSAVQQYIGSSAATSSEIATVKNNIDLIKNIIRKGPNVVANKIPMTGTASTSSAINDAYDLLKANREFIQAETIAFIESSLKNFTYSKDFCFRDVGLIVEAVAGDARFGGNQRSLIAGLSYWDNATSLIPGESVQTVSALEYLESLTQSIIINETIDTTYQSEVSQVINLNYDKGAVVSTRVSNLLKIISDIIADGPSAEPQRVFDLNGLIYPTGLSPNRINVASTVTAVTSLGGNLYRVTLSSPTVSPSDDATVYFGYTSTYPFLDADVPAEWTVADNDGIFADRRLDPHGAGGGALVDGNAPSSRSPIQSFVFDAFTQVCQGGRGISVINNGYAQLVSVFTLFCDQAVTVENGGIASITNSNANFGDLCLVAKGIGSLDFSGIVWNPAYPTNIPNGEFYPLGYWPASQKMEVFIPNDRDRPHIGQVMEVIPPDTYIDYNGNRVPLINEAGFPGYLVATSNTSSVTTGSYTISGIDITNIAVGHKLYIKDVYGESGPDGVGSYITPGAQVVDVRYQEVELDLPILNGGGDLSNANFLNLYFCGNAYYTVLSSTLDESLASTFTSATSVIPSERTTTTQAIAYARDLALQIIANQTATLYQSDVSQIIDTRYDQGAAVSSEVASKFNTMISIITGTSTSTFTINGQIAKTDRATLDAKKLLEKNRNFIQAQTVGYTDTLWPKVFNYNSDICARDTRLIVDALAQDLLFGGSSQSTFAGIQYYGQGNTVIPNEITTTTRAINYASELAQKIILNNTSGYRYQSSSTQITALPVATSSEASKIATDFSVITNIIQNGIEFVTDTIVPNDVTPSTDENIVKAYTNLQANKEYIQHEVVAYVDATSKFVYDQEKCYRDVGLFVDSLAFDIAYPSDYDSQTTFAALQYWNNSGYVGAISSEITTTTSAIIYLSQVAQYVVTSNTAWVPKQTGPDAVIQVTSTEHGDSGDLTIVGARFSDILDVLFNGTGGVSEKIYNNPNGRATDKISTNNAYQLLLTNKEFLKAEVIAYIESTKTSGFTYDQTLCRRDIGYMVDSVAFDLLHGGKRQSIQSGVYYYGYDSNSTAVPGEIPQVTAAYNYMKQIISSVVAGQKITPSAGNIVPQITYMLPASDTEVGKLGSLIDNIVTIINNGPSVVQYKTPISLTPSSNPNADKAFDLLIANRQFIQEEITNWINNNFCGFDYDRSKCFRDVGYMVDSVSIDLLYGGNRQAVQSGVYYFGHSNDYVPRIGDEIPQVNAAYNFLSSLTAQIMQNIEVTPYQDKVKQSFYTIGATISEVSDVASNISLILDIINTGPSIATNITSLGTTATIAPTTLASVKLLHDNRDFIAAEVISYINETYHTGFVYDKAVCKRDTGLIVDSIAFDLLYNGNTQSVFSGLQYWAQKDYVGAVGEELTTTTNAMRYLREIVSKVILKETVVVSPENVETQNTSLTAGSAEAAQSVVDNMTTIIDIITNGKAGVTDRIIPNGTASVSTGTTNAYAILQANKSFLQAEVVARINLDNPYFTYNQTTCSRDVGYIVDSLSFDLLHGGNRQSIQSGVYYTGFDSDETVIKDEKVEVNAAYDYLRSLIPFIVQGVAIPNSYQPKVYENKNLHVPQVRDLPTAGSGQYSLMQNSIDVITSIISGGPGAAPAKTPIGLTASTDPAVINAFNMILANKAFIQAELLAFIDRTFTYVPVYNKNKCYRDMGSIIDSVIYDLTYGGNYRSVNTGNGYYYRNGQYHIITLEQNVVDPLLFVDGATVNFYQQSYISASGYLFEYVGAGTQYGALPQVGFADPVQSKETVQLNNGKVFFTSTDQNGDFRIGPTLVISQATGVLSGRTFQKSLFAEMTPFILVVGA